MQVFICIILIWLRRVFVVSKKSFISDASWITFLRFSHCLCGMLILYGSNHEGLKDILTFNVQNATDMLRKQGISWINKMGTVFPSFIINQSRLVFLPQFYLSLIKTKFALHFLFFLQEKNLYNNKCLFCYLTILILLLFSLSIVSHEFIFLRYSSAFPSSFL